MTTRVVRKNMTEIYQRLANHLDHLPAGFPATETGVELRILKRLFTPEEAALAIQLTMLPESSAQIAARLGEDPDALAKRLEQMAQKGLLFRSSKKETDYYMAAQFVIGIWEYHLNDLDEGLIKDVNEYLPYLMQKTWLKQKTKQLRVIPVSKEISAEMAVTSYEAAEEIIRRQSKIVVSPCICRREHEMTGNGCGKLSEACLSFGGAAYFYERNRLGRAISRTEALDLLKKGPKDGLVLQPSNSQHPINICMCCGCCCQILKNIRSLDNPAAAVHANYSARINAQECTACESCADICPMAAIQVDETAVVDPERCIGCGLCAAECPTGAAALYKKRPEEQYVPPRNTVETYINMARERGLI